MRTVIRWVLLLAVVASLRAAETKSQVVAVGDWNITVPSGTEKKVTNGPDFSVIYFVFNDLKASLGIYEGGFPQKFSKDIKNLKAEKDEVGGQNVIWTLWSQSANGSTLCSGELFLSYEVHRTISPNIKADYTNKLHIFLSAPDEKTLAVIKEIVRTLNRIEPGKPASPKS